MPATNNADLRVDKTFQISRDVVVGLYGDVFNVNNQGVAQRVNFQSGPNLGLPVAWSAPRTLRVGIKVHF